MSKHDSRDKKMVELFRSGFTYAELSEQNGLSESRVRKIIRTAGVGDKEGGLYVRPAPTTERPTACYAQAEGLLKPSLFDRVASFFRGV